MKNLMMPSRAAPSVEDAKKAKATHCGKPSAKPPPRPPPPNFYKMKSKSAWNLGQNVEGASLIDLSPPASPNHFVATRNRAFGGSVSSSYSSSTSSLTSSKRSFEYEVVNVDPWSANTPQQQPPQQQSTSRSATYTNNTNHPSEPTFYVDGPLTVPALPTPTIIRAKPTKKPAPMPKIIDKESSPPMPRIPPPSPPKDAKEVVTPFAIAMFEFPGTQKEDLPLQVGDLVLLLRRINTEWLFGRVDDREGMFPASFIDVQVPLPGDENIVRALYEFQPQMAGDLEIKPGQEILITGRVNAEWLIGESNGQKGQFPANFVDRIPPNV